MIRAPLLVRALTLLALVPTLAPSLVRAEDSAPPLSTRLRDALGELDRAPLRSGVLLDRAVILSGLQRFDGRENAPAASPALLRQMAFELRQAANPGALSTDPDRLRERGRSLRPGEPIPIALVDVTWERIEPAALARGTLAWRDGRLESRGGSSLLPGRTFAAAALVEGSAHGGALRFVLDRDASIRQGALPTRLDVDFADGLGFRTARFDVPIGVHYATTGSKRVRLRATGADGVTRHASFDFVVRALAAPSPDDTLHVTASVPWQGQFATGDAYVYRAPGHATLVNPAIVIEGFDIDNSMHWDELYAQLNQENLLETLRAQGFDAVVLDFTDATIAMQANSLLVAELLQQVQNAIAPTTSVALVGASMGAVCSRYALAWLESQAIPYRVRTWISFDGPHDGADLPLGIQYWVNFFSDLSSDAAFLRDRLNTPAARQMLLYHFTDPPTNTGQPDAMRAQWNADLAAVGGWPSRTRTVAIVNGGGHGTHQGFAPGDQLIAWSYSSFFISITGNVWAVPNATSRTIFDGRVRIAFSDSRQTVTVAGTRPWDGAPGGFRTTMADMDAVAAPYGDIVALHPNHDFIPVGSALALGTTDLFHDLLGDPGFLGASPFDVVHVPAANQEHVTVTPENAAWFLAEIGQGVVDVPIAASSPDAGVSLAAPQPNPFAGSTAFRWTLPRAAEVDLGVFAVDGARVATLARGPVSAGTRETAWNGSDESGRRVPAGLYFVRLDSSAGSSVRRLVKLN